MNLYNQAELPFTLGEMESLPVKLLRPSAQMPRRAHGGDLGYDLYAAAPAVLPPGDWSTVATGIAIALPLGAAGLILPRSGLAANDGISVLNAPGLIDAGYRGEVGVILINHGHETFHVSPGDRIAQLLLTPAHTPTLNQVPELPQSEDGRDQGGFGSSGAR